MLRVTTQNPIDTFWVVPFKIMVRFSAHVSPIARGTKNGGLPNSEERTRTKAAPVGVTSSPVALHFIARPGIHGGKSGKEKGKHEVRLRRGFQKLIGASAVSRAAVLMWLLTFTTRLSY